MIGGDFDQRTTAAGASADRVGIERAGDQVVFGGVSASLVSQCRSSHPFSISFLPLVNSSLCFLTIEITGPGVGVDERSERTASSGSRASIGCASRESWAPLVPNRDAFLAFWYRL